MKIREMYVFRTTLPDSRAHMGRYMCEAEQASGERMAAFFENFSEKMPLH